MFRNNCCKNEWISTTKALFKSALMISPASESWLPPVSWKEPTSSIFPEYLLGLVSSQSSSPTFTANGNSTSFTANGNLTHMPPLILQWPSQLYPQNLSILKMNFPLVASPCSAPCASGTSQYNLLASHSVSVLHTCSNMGGVIIPKQQVRGAAVESPCGTPAPCSRLPGKVPNSTTSHPTLIHPGRQQVHRSPVGDLNGGPGSWLGPRSPPNDASIWVVN